MAERFEGIELGLSAAQFGVGEVVNAAAQAEALGFRRVWIAERYLAAGAFAQCAAALARTSRVGVGTGIVSPYARPNAVTAMETAALDAISGGRFILGLGVATSVREAMGATSKPLPFLRDSLREIRALLSGGEGAPGRISVPPSSGGVPLRPGGVPLRPGGIPLFVGTMGARTLEMAAGLADGVLLSYFTTPAFLADALRCVEAGLGKAGRAPGEVELSSYIALALEGDPKRGGRFARQMIAPRLASPLAIVPKVFRMAGIADAEVGEVRARVQAAYARGDAEGALAAVPDAWCGKLTIVGPPDACAERLLEFARGGLKYPALYMMPGADLAGMLKEIKEELFPLLL